MRFALTWNDGHATQRWIIEAASADDAVHQLVERLGHSPDCAYEVEPLDDLGYARRRPDLAEAI